MKHRHGLALSFAVLAGLLAPSSGLAATTIGQSPPTDGAPVVCAAGSAHVQDGVNGGVPYIVPPGGGVITSWSHDAAATPGTMALATFREELGATNYSPLAESQAETITPSTKNTFDTRIPVIGGELIGLHVVTGQVMCRHFTNLTGDFDFWDMAPPPPGSGVNSYGQAQERYRLNVSAVIEPDADGDGFGDETQDGCPNDPRGTDCINPEVTIDKGPRKQSKKRTAKFLFSSNESGATFECSLDGKPFTACTSPLKTKKLKRRKHTFAVHAVDAGANKSADAVYKWKVKKKKKK